MRKLVKGSDVAQKIGKVSKYRKGLLEILIRTSKVCLLNLIASVRFQSQKMDLAARKPVFGGLRTTKLQTSLCIRAV